MIPAPFHPQEEERLKALRELGLLDTPPEERFDRITAMVRRLFHAPMSVISLVDEHRQFFKSRQGIEAEGTSREISFCGHAILRDEVMHVPDATEDERFRDNPMVTGDPRIRMYAGYPLRTLDGLPVGTLCVMDHEARQLTAGDLENLRDLGVWVEHEMNALQLERLVLSLHTNQEELRLYQDRILHVNRILKRLASADALTGIPNRLYLEEHLAEEFLRRRRKPSHFALIMLDIDHFKRFNDLYGHLAGDECLVQVARSLEDSLKRPADFAARFGGEEFVVVLPDTDRKGADSITRQIVLHYQNLPPLEGLPPGSARPTVSMGVAFLSPQDLLPERDLIELADRALYASKKAGRNRVTYFDALDQSILLT